MVEQEEVEKTVQPGFDASKLIAGKILASSLERAVTSTHLPDTENADAIKAEVLEGIRNGYGAQNTWYTERTSAFGVQTETYGSYIVGVRFERKKPRVICIEPETNINRDAETLVAYMVREMKSNGAWREDAEGLPCRAIANNLAKIESDDVTRYIRGHFPTMERHRARVVFEYARVEAHSKAMDESQPQYFV